MTKVKVTTTGSLHANCCKKGSFMIKRQQTDSDSDMMHTLHKLLIFLVLMCFGGNVLGSEIINGKKTKQRSKQYMASLQNKGKHFCGGFLISEDFVLTAAHCQTSRPVSVVLGTHNLKKVDETMRYSVKMCPHPSYKKLGSGNDIMLLKLSRKARMGKKPIKPVKLPKREMKLKDKKKCTVAGWGYTRTDGEAVSELQEVEVPVINMTACQKAWNNGLPAKTICAGGIKNGFCQGDSGGPLVCEKLAVGIVSFNNQGRCDYPDIPNVYTDISKFLPWIKDKLDKKNC